MKEKGKDNLTLEALRDKETTDDVYLGDAVLHKNFAAMHKANTTAIFDIDAVITNIGESLTSDEISNDFWVMLFRYLFEIRKKSCEYFKRIGGSNRPFIVSE